jgi:hypothetical protein
MCVCMYVCIMRIVTMSSVGATAKSKKTEAPAEKKKEDQKGSTLCVCVCVCVCMYTETILKSTYMYTFGRLLQNRRKLRLERRRRVIRKVVSSTLCMYVCMYVSCEGSVHSHDEQCGYFCEIKEN